MKNGNSQPASNNGNHNKMETIDIIVQEYGLINLLWHGIYALALMKFSSHIFFMCSVYEVLGAIALGAHNIFVFTCMK